MRPETSVLTETDKEVQTPRFLEADGDDTGVRSAQEEDARTAGDIVHIESSAFAINVLFGMPEDLPSWLIELEQQIDQMAWLESDFDRDGSPPIRTENLEAAKQLARRLFRERQLQCTDAAPTAQGGVELELQTEFWEATIWVNDPESVEYFVKYGQKKRSGKAPLRAIPDKIWETLA